MPNSPSFFWPIVLHFNSPPWRPTPSWRTTPSRRTIGRWWYWSQKWRTIGCCFAPFLKDIFLRFWSIYFIFVFSLPVCVIVEGPSQAAMMIYISIDIYYIYIYIDIDRYISWGNLPQLIWAGVIFCPEANCLSVVILHDLYMISCLLLKLQSFTLALYPGLVDNE